MANGRAFTSAEDAELVQLREVQKMDWGAIADCLDRRASVCRDRYRKVTGRVHSSLDVKLGEGAPGSHLPEPHFAAGRRALIEQGEARLAARSLRDHAELFQGNCTAAFFGDPPPGYSVLDRRIGATRPVLTDDAFHGDGA